MIITSEKNERIKELVKLHQKKYRQRTGSFLVEGFRFVREAFLAEAEVVCLLVRQDTSLEDLDVPGQVEVLWLAAPVFDRLGQTEESQGILAVVKKPSSPDLPEKAEGLWVGLCGVQDPGNLGTLLRTCVALGVRGVVLEKGTCDPYNDKALRASMGAIFHLAIFERDDAIDFGREIGADVVASTPHGQEFFDERTYSEPTLLLIGNEGEGLSDDHLCRADVSVTIPITGQAESLNAAMAAGILIYGIVRRLGLARTVGT